MTRTKKTFAAIVLSGLALVVAGLAAAPFHTSARAAGQTEIGVAADRIGEAFATIRPAEADPAIQAAAVRASKGDLEVSPNCASQTWPSIAPGCLATADGAPAPQVRYVTFGQQTDEAETVLLRVPASQIAAQ